MSRDYSTSQSLGANPDPVNPYLARPLNNTSAVSWGAILAGAAAAASLAMILLILGVGLGLSSISPYGNQGVDASTIGIATIAWLIFTQIAASGMGGYIAGRLRTKWADTHVNEIYFRDTAHGFLAWAVSALISAILLTGTIGSIVGGSAKTLGAVAGGTASVSMKGMMDDSNGSSMSYYVNSLFRASGDASQSNNAAISGNQSPATGMQSGVGQNVKAMDPAQLKEVTGIFAHSISTGTLPPEDLQYVARLVSQNTGMTQQQAEQRVQTIFTTSKAKVQEAIDAAKQAAEKARKVSIHLALWTFVSLLIGAFVASLCATFGGRQRDL